jgi:tetratricopeptide (TPR) repeat protein
MKHYFILSVIFILIGQVSLAQTNKNPKYLIDAKKVFASGNYFEAINQCEKTYKKLGTRGSIKDKGEVAFILAECYRRLEKYEKANDWYGRCIELKYFDRLYIMDINIQDKHYNKYIKYKLKYFELKKQSGGVWR